MFSALKEKFLSQERCVEASCSDSNPKSSAVVYPPDRVEIGRAAWKYGHARAESFIVENREKEIQWIEAFVALYPCRNCALEFAEICDRLPPDLTSNQSYQKWWIEAHNQVNRDLGKPFWSATKP